MLDIQGELNTLILTGRELLARSRELASLKRQIHKRVGAGVDILDLAFDLTGYKRTAKRVGSLLAQQNVAQTERTLGMDHEMWLEGAKALLGKVSLYKKNLTSRGNSSILLRQFGKTMRFSRIETRIRHGLTFLEGLLHGELIPNSELSEHLRLKRERVRSRGKAIASIGEVRKPGEVFPSISEKEFRRALAECPSAEQALMGALNSFKSQGPDANRQSLASCRIALENVVREVSGETDWKNGLVKTVKSRAKRKTIRTTYQYLSGYGSHGQTPASKLDAQVGIQMTVMAIALILSVSA